jgi:hypothetical protein
MRLYHCTSCTDAEKIIAERFRCGAGGLTGGRIYSAQSVEDSSRKARQQGVVLVCDVDLGRVMNVGFNGDPSLNISRLNRMGNNSVCIPRKGTECCVYEPYRVKIVGQRKDPYYDFLKSFTAHLVSLQADSEVTELLETLRSIQIAVQELDSLTSDWSLECKRHPTVRCDGCDHLYRVHSSHAN